MRSKSGEERLKVSRSKGCPDSPKSMEEPMLVIKVSILVGELLLLEVF